MNFGKKSLLVVSTVAVLGLVLSLGPVVVGGQGGTTLFLPIISRAQTTLAQLVQVEDNILPAPPAPEGTMRYPEGGSRFVAFKGPANEIQMLDWAAGATFEVVFGSGRESHRPSWEAHSIEWMHWGLLAVRGSNKICVYDAVVRQGTCFLICPPRC